MNSLYEQYREDIKDVNFSIMIGTADKGYTNMTAMIQKLARKAIKKRIRKTYINATKVMIERLVKAEHRANDLYQKSKLAIDQSVELHSRNLRVDLERELELIKSHNQ